MTCSHTRPETRFSKSLATTLAVALTFALGCGDNLAPVTPPDANPPPPPPFALRAVVYPYIPNGPDDAEARLAERLEAEFEDAHPEVDVDLHLSWDADPYDYDSVAVDECEIRVRLRAALRRSSPR